jgi:hypothetical protein
MEVIEEFHELHVLVVNLFDVDAQLITPGHECHAFLLGMFSAFAIRRSIGFSATTRFFLRHPAKKAPLRQLRSNGKCLSF